MYEPQTPEQCPARMHGVESSVRITPDMRELGVTLAFSRR